MVYKPSTREAWLTMFAVGPDWPQCPRVSGALRSCRRQLLQADSHAGLVPFEDPSEGPQILTADGDRPPAEVASLYLDHAYVAADHVPFRRVHLSQADQVDAHGWPLCGAFRGRRVAVSAVSAARPQRSRQELVDGHPVELSQALQAKDGDYPLASLIGTEDRRLELTIRVLLHGEQRQPSLPAKISKPVSYCPGI